MDERREDTRIKVAWRGRMLCEKGRLSSVLVRDVSVGGISVETSEILKPGKKIKIEFWASHLGKRYMVRSEVQVVHTVHLANSQGFYAGVQFVKMGEEYKEVLKTLIAFFGR